MQSYIFRIMENDGHTAPAVNRLINNCNGTYKALETKDGIIYETEFPTEQDVEKFRAELTRLLGIK